MTPALLSPLLFRRLRRTFLGVGFSTLAAAASISSARAELLVLQTGGSGEGFGAVQRYDPAAGIQTGVFGEPNEGFLSLAVSPQQEVFVPANVLGAHSLLRFNRAGQFLGVVASGWQAEFAGGVRGPDGNVYAAVFDPATQHTHIARLAGPTPTVFVPYGAGGMTAASGMIFGPDQNLYVADRQAGILRFNGATGAFINVLVPFGRGGLQEVTRMTFGPNGRLYVASREANGVLRFDGVTGDFVDLFATAADATQPPTGLAFGPDGDLYVSSQNSSSVRRYDGRTGAFVGALELDRAVRRPADLAFLPAGAHMETVWFDDALPSNAEAGGDGKGVTRNPEPFTGVVAQQTPASAGMSEHSVCLKQGAWSVNEGDALYAYVNVDERRTAETAIMLSWTDAAGEEHRAYWGADRIARGENGTATRRYMGELPKSGWQRLEVPAATLGLEGKAVRKILFSVHAGGARWDRVGKTSASFGNVAAGNRDFGNAIVAVDFRARAARAPAHRLD